jgi:hypothetical protein
MSGTVWLALGRPWLGSRRARPDVQTGACPAARRDARIHACVSLRHRKNTVERQLFALSGRTPIIHNSGANPRRIVFSLIARGSTKWSR